MLSKTSCRLQERIKPGISNSSSICLAFLWTVACAEKRKKSKGNLIMVKYFEGTVFWDQAIETVSHACIRISLDAKFDLIPVIEVKT